LTLGQIFQLREEPALTPYTFRMPLVTLRNVSVTHGGPPVLEGVDLRLDPGERVCLLGRNGCGKTTLIKVISGEVETDRGEVEIEPGLAIGHLPQEVPELTGTVFDVVAGGLGPEGDRLAEHHLISTRLTTEPEDRALLARLGELQRELDSSDGWQLHRRVEKTLSRAKLDPDVEASALSAGQRRLALLARALVLDPDLLLLDEPTNHLDIEVISWLEELLLGYGGALLFVTHDRAFLRRLATRIVDLDRGVLMSFPGGDYDSYQQEKQARLETEARRRAAFDRKLAAEETWVRQGVKERRTRNEGRVRRLQEMRAERRVRRERLGTVKLVVQEAERSGRLVIRAEKLHFAYGERTLVRDFSSVIMRGDRVGIIGPNGSGKTTLLRLLLGEIVPDQGEVHHGTRLEVAYFDQLHQQLDEERTVLDNVADGSDHVTVNGRRVHVIGYLRNFLFTPDRARGPVASLSGGERNRLLLARLFARPSNVLVLDEPTNDLDLETLELIETLLQDYPGTVLLVSHDRALLDNVVTSSLVLEGGGRIREFVGGYDDWLGGPPLPAKPRKTPSRSAAAADRPREDRPRRITYKERLELEALPDRIEALEREIEALHGEMADPAFYRQEGAKIAEARTRLSRLEADLDAAFRRWEALESKG